MGKQNPSRLFLERSSQLDYKFLIFKQLDRVGAISVMSNTETGTMIHDIEKRIGLAVTILQRLVQPWINTNEEAKKRIAEATKPLEKLGYIVELLDKIGMLPERDTFEEI